MKNYLLAIDIHERIPQFAERFAAYTEISPKVSVNTEQALSNLADTTSVEGILVSIYQVLSEEFLARFTSLRFILVLGTSSRQIAMDYCSTHNIKVFVVSEYCDIETAEWVMLQVMKFFRMRRNPAQSVYKKSLGIIGMGGVGRRLLPLAKALGMSVYYSSRKPHPDLDAEGIPSLTNMEMFSICNVISHPYAGALCMVVF